MLFARSKSYFIVVDCYFNVDEDYFIAVNCYFIVVDLLFSILLPIFAGFSVNLGDEYLSQNLTIYLIINTLVNTKKL